MAKPTSLTTMTDNSHPITPPPELVKQWLAEFYGPESMPGMAPGEMVLHVAAVAARWGADQELEACCEHLKRSMSPRATVDYLRADRRPPPSLAEEALAVFAGLMDELDGAGNYSNCAERIRRALKRLQELEGQSDG